MNIVINNVDFWDNFEAQKYYSVPKTMSHEVAKEKVKKCLLSEEYLAAAKKILQEVILIIFQKCVLLVAIR